MAENLRIDHVAIGSRDLDVTSAWLASVAGVHATESWFFSNGLCNRIAYGGGAAVEILGVAFPGAEMVSPLIAQISARTIARDRWIAWALETDDIEATASRLGLEVMDGGATSLSGHSIKWQMAGVIEAFFSDPFLPFFLQYAGGMDEWREHALQPESTFDLCRVELSGDPDRFEEWVAGAELPVEVVAGPPSIGSVTLSTSSGEVELRLGS